MQQPNVPHRFEFTIDVTGTPEQVWDAIATSGGLSAWFLPTQLEERMGGAVRFEMGEGQSSPATITGWDPPHRLAYDEPEWMVLAGQPRDAPVTAMATEFLVEARSGGTCVVRIVSSAFGTGADWEGEFFEGMADGFVFMLYGMRSYLAHFAGQRARTFSVEVKFAATDEEVRAAMADRLGAREVGQIIDVDGRTAEVDQLEPALMLHQTAPVPGIVRCWTWCDDSVAVAQVTGYLFGDDAATAAERDRQAWSAWLGTLDVAS